MDSFYGMIRRHWPSALAVASFVLPWTLTSPTSIPVVNIFTVWGEPSAYAFFVLPLLLLVPMLHLMQMLMEPRGFWRSLLTWTATFIIACYSCFFASLVMVGSAGVYDGELPGPGYALALAGCLAAMVWEPLMEHKERRLAPPPETTFEVDAH